MVSKVAYYCALVERTHMVADDVHKVLYLYLMHNRLVAVELNLTNDMGNQCSLGSAVMIILHRQKK
jgi:hypothetical protein